MTRIAIVGAGISGLSIAYRLQEMAPGAELLLLEQQNRPGGAIWTDTSQGYSVEIGPNGFLDSVPSTLTLCRDLGLGDQLVPASESAGRQRYLFLDNQLKPLPGTLAALLRSNLLSWRGKLGFLAERFRPRGPGSGDESVDAFARRRAGREVAAVLIDGLVTGIYAGDPTLLSMRAAFPRVASLETKYCSVLKGLGRMSALLRAENRSRQRGAAGTRLWSFRSGMRVLIEGLCSQLRNPPLLGVNVRRVVPARASGIARPSWMVLGAGDPGWKVDAVVLACPAYQQAAIVAELDGALAEKIAAVPYNRVAVVGLGYDRADIPGNIDGFGFIAPQRTGRDLLGVQWCSSIFPGRAPAHGVLLRVLCGGWNRPEVAGWEAGRLLAAIRAELRLAMGIEAAPRFHHVVRWDRAIPQYHIGHLERVAWIEQRACLYPGLFLAGNAYHGVAVNDCTSQASVVARRVQTYLASTTRDAGANDTEWSEPSL